MKKEGGAKIYMNESLKAVHDDDVEQLLQSLNMLDPITKGECKCIYCNEIITLDNIAAVVPLDKGIHFVCNNNSCYGKLLLEEA